VAPQVGHAQRRVPLACSCQVIWRAGIVPGDSKQRDISRGPARHFSSPSSVWACAMTTPCKAAFAILPVPAACGRSRALETMPVRSGDERSGRWRPSGGAKSLQPIAFIA